MIRLEPVKLIFALCASLLFIGSGRGAEKDLSLSDINGKTHQPLDVGKHKAVVLFFVSPYCPTSNTFTPEINNIAVKYAEQFDFYLVEADAEIPLTDARKHAESLEIKAPLLLDPKQQLARLTKAKTTPEVVVLAANGDTLYRGRINNLYATQTRKLKEPTSHDLRVALDALVANKPVPTPATTAIGCSITVAP